MAQNALSTGAAAPVATGGAVGGAVPERPRPVGSGAGGRLARVPDVASVVLTVVAVAALLTALSHALRMVFAPLQVPADLFLIGVPTSLSGAAFFALVAAAVERRKRVGWWVVVVVGGLHLLGSAVLALALWFAPTSTEDTGLSASDLERMPPAAVATALVTIQLAALVVFVLARRQF